MNEKIKKAIAKIGLEFEALSIYPMTWDIHETEDVPTMGTDYKNLYYSPSFVDKLSEEEVVAVILHEVFHCVLLHPSQVDRDISKGKNNFVWSLALEQVVNAEVLEIISGTNYRLPGKAVDPRKIVAGQLNPNEKGYVFSYDLRGKNEIEIYDILIKHYKDNAEKSLTPGQIELAGDVIPQDAMSSEEKQAALEKAIATIKKLQKAGKISDNLERLLKELTTPRIPWQRVLQSFIAQVTDGYEFFSFTKPNIRRQTLKDVVIPAIQQLQVGEPVVVFDTSGSIDNDTLQKFVSELDKLLKDVVESVVVITVDTQIKEKVRVNSVKEALQKIRFKGGGGTDFRPLFEQVKKCEFMIFFTDGYAEYPTKPPAYPVLWVLTEDHRKPPFGKVAYIYK